MRQIWVILLMSWLVPMAASNVLAGAVGDDAIVGRVRQIAEEVKAASYPELAGVEIKIELFDSSSDYFQTRFTFTSFLFKKRLRYLLKVNRNVFAHGVPEDGLRAIMAHELWHVADYKRHHRIELLGLARLVCGGFTARFERATDLEAIARGYGGGLKNYRWWLYNQIPAKKLKEKKRNYFSPAEVDALQEKLRLQPELMKQWRKHPPRSLQEIVELQNQQGLPTISIIH